MFIRNASIQIHMNNKIYQYHCLLTTPTLTQGIAHNYKWGQGRQQHATTLALTCNYNYKDYTVHQYYCTTTTHVIRDEKTTTNNNNEQYHYK